MNSGDGGSWVRSQVRSAARTRWTCLGVSLLLTLAGCSYWEKVTNRAGAPDHRMQLGLRDSTRYLTRRELSQYTCAERLLFVCERGGAAKYACRCVLR
jgi:hypothetical protein